jgi:Raf kinase inhibitor-like YbhB/YbcL family protein
MNKKNTVYILMLMLLASGLFGCAVSQGPASQEQIKTFNPITNIAMKLTSPAFLNGEKIPAKYTCDGENISPPLTISQVLPAAKSLVLILDDPDAPAGDFVHWTVFNINPATAEITEGSVPAGAAQGLTDFNSNVYGGPCPPSGIHHYQFKLYAVDKILNIPQSSRKKDIEKAMGAGVLDQALLVGLVQRNK